MASVFRKPYWDKRTGERRLTTTYYMKYYVGKKAIVKTTKQTNRRNALKIAKQKEAEAIGGAKPWEADAVTYKDLIDGLIVYYEINNRRSTDRLMRSVSHLNKYFDGMKANDITAPVIRKYIKHRLAEKKPRGGDRYAPATINRELAALKTSFKLAHKDGRINAVPHIAMLKENNVRQGYLNPEEFNRLMKVLPEYLQPYVQFCYLTGMRREEVAGLTWDNFDDAQLVIRLNEVDAKNNEPRIIPIVGGVSAVLMHQFQNVLEKSEYIFPNADCSGKIKDFRFTWNKACRKAELGYGYRLNGKYVAKWQDKFEAGPLLHDLRRSMATNAIEAGVSEKVVMELGGWKTDSILKRYHIVKKDHLIKALKKQGDYLRVIGENQEV